MDANNLGAQLELRRVNSAPPTCNYTRLNMSSIVAVQPVVDTMQDGDDLGRCI